MTPIKLILSTAALALTAAAAPAFAASTTLVIKDFVGTISVETSNNADLRITKKSKSSDVEIDGSANTLVIDGGIDRPDGNKCKGYYGSVSWSLFGKKEKSERVGGYEDLDDYPKLTISAPDDVKLVIENAIPFGDAGDIGSADIELSHCGRLEVGNIAGNADIKITGSGDMSAENIGSVKARVTGSGDLEFMSTGDADLRSKGSGNIDFENADNVDLTISGSSDVNIETVTGQLSIRSSGSSDIDVETVGAGLDYEASGSGDFSAQEVNGDANISARGSSDIDIGGGNIGTLTIAARGSSDVDFGGTAQDAHLTASGSSDINVHRVEDLSHTKASGSADIDVGN